MAWPCISRVCCLARFWNQFDKSDLSVPLTIHNYSDIAEQEVRSVTKARKDVTQYKQDFKPWPIPRKDNFPWISNGGSRTEGVPDGPGDREDRGSGQRWVMEDSKTSSYRQEYRAWTGVKPAKSARKAPSAQYSSPGTEPTQVPRETSYQAAYSGEVSRSIGVNQVDHILPSAASTQPPPVTQNTPQAGSSPSPFNLQQSLLPEGSEHTRREV
uniref:MAP6 domain containing 1 n=1 Tax=Nothobranchius furzeri TaxID=105023 RepID=A0A8C6PRY1_NOTFU